MSDDRTRPLSRVVPDLLGTTRPATCEDVDGGWVTQQLIAHLYRVSIAAEVID